LIIVRIINKVISINIYGTTTTGSSISLVNNLISNVLIENWQSNVPIGAISIAVLGSQVTFSVVDSTINNGTVLVNTNGFGLIQGSNVYNLQLLSGTLRVDTDSIDYVTVSGGTLIKQGPLLVVDQFIWNGGSISGPSNITLEGYTEITGGNNLVSSSGNIINAGTLNITNPLKPTVTVCLALNSGCVLTNEGSLFIDSYCNISGTGSIVQYNIGNVTLGNSVTFNVYISLGNSQKCWINTVIQNVVYLYGGAHLGCTLNITSSGSAPHDQSSYTLVQGVNITGNFNYINYKPLPRNSKGKLYEIFVNDNSNHYTIRFDSAGAIAVSLVLLVLSLLF